MVKRYSGGVISANVPSNTAGLYTVTNQLQLNQEGDWLQKINIDYLVVGGGGAGHCNTGKNTQPGGGAGGFIEGTVRLYKGVPITVVVGAGGAQLVSDATANPGTSSSFDTVTANGGGAGFHNKNGGSGGGGAHTTAGGIPSTVAITGKLGLHTVTLPQLIAYQGYAGGSTNTTSNAYGMGGGGGAGGAGGNGTDSGGGNGGIGRQSSITGVATYYAGGGGGGAYLDRGTNSGVGGLGGGGAAGRGSNGSTGQPGIANTGGGGGGHGGTNGVGSAGSGGSGVVILRVSSNETANNTTGNPSVTVSGGYRIYTFTSSGTITF